MVRMPNSCTSPVDDSIQPSKADFDAAYTGPNELPIAAPRDRGSQPEHCLRISEQHHRVAVIGPNRSFFDLQTTCSVVDLLEKPRRSCPR